jgi:hypothetical protein
MRRPTKAEIEEITIRILRDIFKKTHLLPYQWLGSAPHWEDMMVG